jgi:sugar (pentulose or hexulose) kinase
MAAAVAVKAFPSFQDAASKFVRFKKQYSPNPKTTVSYDKAFELYLHLIESYRPHWKTLANLREEPP